MKDSHVESQQRLQHIEQAIADIEKFTKGESLKTFCEKDMLHDAVMMQFIIIGEAFVMTGSSPRNNDSEANRFRHRAFHFNSSGEVRILTCGTCFPFLTIAIGTITRFSK